MKNRAALLALIVLAIATLLMIFVIRPWLSGNGENLPDVAGKTVESVKQAAEKAGENAPQAVAQIKEKATATLEKMGRLSENATGAVSQFAGLFGKGGLPSAEAFEQARGKAEAALSDLAAIEVPEGIAGDALANATELREQAVKAIEWLKALPADPKLAASAIDGLKEIFPLAFRQEQATAPEAPKAAAQEPASVAALPTFDVLRVEPDGSTVIAGRAAAGVTVEIVSEETVLTKATTGPGGEFAAVLDNPLSPGDHELALRATGADGSVAVSGEVATVSVPKDKDGQLLAMISTPGQASRLLTIPSANGPQTAADASQNASAASDAARQQGTAPAASAASAVRVTAVEIENDRIFVAGAAKPGATIRAFAGTALIGETVTDASGHFVVDGALKLIPGDHLIMVEMLDETGKVAMKVSVPFNRPEGSQVAAVAGEKVETGVAAPVAASADANALARLREDVSKAFTLLKSLFADGKVPGKEELAAARSATLFALKALSEFLPGADASEAVKAEGASLAASAAKAASALSALPEDAAAFGKGFTALAPQIEAMGAAPAPQAVSQAPLTPSASAVIIRRGDTLWQISRRVYGQGVRYTTIYLANRDAINNPDLIEPGQVFTVPREALPNAEELHRKRLSGEQLQ